MAGQGGAIQVIGLNETLKSVRDFGDKGTLDAVKKANVEAAQSLIKAALPLTPKRSGALAGTLKASNTLKFAAARAGSTRVPYAGPIHWGWAVVGGSHKGKLSANSSRRFRNIKPQPFFAQAYGYNKQEILANYQEQMQKALKHYGLK